MTFTDTELDALWDNYCEAGNANGSTENGAIDLYDIDGMFEAAAEMRDAITYLRQRASLAEAIIANSGITHFDQQPQRDPIGAKIMQERAAEHIRTLHTVTLMTPDQNAALQIAANGIDRCPIPTQAEVLAYARELPEVKALVDEVRRFNARVISGEVRSTKTFNAFCNCLSALEPKP